MARILITSGPTRQYLDPVRYLSNGSSGRMGRALVQAALDQGHEVIVVSGPVELEYPPAAQLIRVVSTEELLEACRGCFPRCEGMIAAAAPCDYRPLAVAPQKMAKTGQPLQLQLIETPDVVAAVGRTKRADQWIVGFALETADPRIRGLVKLEKKSCDLMVLNGPEAMHSLRNEVEVIDRSGQLLAAFAGSKQEVADRLLQIFQQRLIARFS